MAELLDAVFRWLLEAPEALVYLVLALFSSLENIVPPIPADVVIVFGGFLAARRGMSVTTVFLVVWLANVAGALLVYVMGRRYGPALFRTRVGGLILRPQQLQALEGFYARWGPGVIFVSRFLPMFRAVVPAFAGISHVGFWRTAIPVAAASGIWYGLIIYFGALAGANWERVVARLAQFGTGLSALAAIAALALVAWWWRSRRAAG